MGAAGAAPLGELIGCLIALPFVMLADWHKFLKRLPPGEQELTKACHGAGIVALVVYWAVLTGGFFHFLALGIHNLVNPMFGIPAVIAAFGVGWFILYARFGAISIGPPHRSAQTMRALLKVALGIAVWSYAGHLDLSGFELLVRAAAMWCMATGGTKFILMIWGRSSGDAYSMVEHDIDAHEFHWDE
jgi:hypothetical protein